MIREISRKTWSSFCRRFNSDNRYRPAQLSFKPSRQSSNTVESDLLGIGLTRKGRLIDGLEILAVRHNRRELDEPRLQLGQLEKLSVEKDQEGHDIGLTAEFGDGVVASLKFTGEPEETSREQLVEKIAYSISEERGFFPGYEEDDWYQAEAAIEELLSELP